MRFVLSKKGGTLKEVFDWLDETTFVLTRKFGLQEPILLFGDEDSEITSVMCECSNKRYEEIKKEYNLIEEHNIRGIRFLKSS